MTLNARRSAHLNVMAEAAQKAGRMLIRDFGEVEHLQVSRKGPADFVSNADIKSEKTIVAALEKARPGYNFLLEEGGAKKGTQTGFRWIVDPLDGTTNFLHGIPHWAISIALEKEGEVIAGVVYDPIKDEMFTAEKGTGALMNNRRLRVAARTTLKESLLVLGNEKANGFAKDIQSLSPVTAGMRRFGSASLDLCYVAAGRFDAFWEENLNAWDVAAGALIIREAGGKVTDYSGGKDYVFGKSIVAGNEKIYGELFRQLNNTLGGKVKSAS
jgi:myo-inositol-1(or 4)-monophosphatase